MKLCECNCGEESPIAKWTDKRRGHVKGKPIRFIHGHHSRLQHTGPRWISNSDGCWIWQLSKDSEGYGIHKWGRSSRKAHRVIYEKIRGVTLTHDQPLDHLCRVRDCVNPDHLEIVTTAENNRRSTLAKLSKEKVKEIRCLLSEGELSQNKIGKLYGVSQTCISKIKNNIRWF